MTILFLISSEGYYGVENMLVLLARKLSQQDCRCLVGVLCDARFPHPEVAKQARRHGLDVELVRCNGRWDRSAVTQIRELLTRHNVEILHPHGYKADVYAYAANWPNRVALLATSHNWPSKLLSMRIYAALDRMLLKRFDKVIVVSEVVADILRRSGVAPERISTIPNGVDVERFRDAAPTLRNEIAPGADAIVGFIGRLVPEKGGDLLLRSAQQVLAVHQKTHFVLIGEGPSRTEWEALAAQLGISQQVTFVGSRSDMPEVYASLDVLALPSLIEAQPMCLLEAMAAGKPVIATRVGAVPKMVKTGETGLLLEPGDVAGLSSGIIRILRDKELARRLGENAQAHVSQCFSAEAMANSYVAQYQGLMDSRRNGSRKEAAWEVS